MSHAFIYFATQLASTQTSDLLVFTQVMSRASVHFAAQLTSPQTSDLLASTQVSHICLLFRPAHIHPNLLIHSHLLKPPSGTSVLFATHPNL
jgi:hypothetical protein